MDLLSLKRTTVSGGSGFKLHTSAHPWLESPSTMRDVTDGGVVHVDNLEAEKNLRATVLTIRATSATVME